MTSADDSTTPPGSVSWPVPPDDSSPDTDADAEYSATVLGSHWFQRPEPETTPAQEPAAVTPATPETPPDRVEGTVLRFGPGVTAALAHRPDMSPPTVVTAPTRTPRGGLRRHVLPGLVLLLVIAFLAWQRSGTGITTDEVAVTTSRATVACDSTADIVGVITTNGRPGTLSYRWVRSDGTTSAVLREVLPAGRKKARVHLLWSFQGEGRYRAQAELHVLSPGRHTSTIRFLYDCS
ncbi:hypothetical protein [Streptomyces sp. NPDC001815]|uniref:hypothetical protein n=1 Tax=Streptomyces sp. NPDC001815 TaxID=3154526 RepID=UPI0033170EA2